MNQLLLKGVLFSLLVIISNGIIAQGKAHLNDTISKSNVESRKTQSTVVSFDAAKLNDILEMCVSKGVTKVQFIFATIRAQDTLTYFSRNPGVAKEIRKFVVGKPTLLLKVPRSAFDLALNDDPLQNKVVKQLVGAGFILLDAPYGGSPLGASGSLYFDMGTVCPPPANCDEALID